MANDPESDEEQGKRDTEGRPARKETDESRRQENEGTEDPAYPEKVGKS